MKIPRLILQSVGPLAFGRPGDLLRSGICLGWGSCRKQSGMAPKAGTPTSARPARLYHEDKQVRFQSLLSG